MRHISKVHYEKVVGHMVRKDGVLCCPESGEEARCVVSGRSIHLVEGMGGFGEVRTVEHPYCPTHDAKPEFSPGAPILEKDLLEMKS